MSDEDLRELERLANDDVASALRFARALVRSGDSVRAAKELARVVEANPSEKEALVALDALTRGGVDPSAPWPGGRGDGRHSGRSRATGPSRGGRIATVDLRGTKLRQGFAVDARGRALVVDGSGTDEVLVAIETSGAREKLGVVAKGAPLLLAGETVVHGPPDTMLHVLGKGTAYAFSPWIVGLGHVVFAKAKQRIEARQLPTRDAPLRWAAPIPRQAAAIALGPGALVHVLTTSGLGARGTFHRFELATGRALPAISLERLGSVDGKIVVGEDGTVFLGLGGSTVALDAGGRPLWRHEGSGFPAALAGASGDVLVLCEPGSFAPFALDAKTGAELWRSRDQCLNGLPKIDASGRIFWRREQELIALDARTGATLLQAIVGPGFWEFAFDGSGHALALRYGGAGELIVLE